jgi:hypothetical protein
MKKTQRTPMTPQAFLRARFTELADAHGIALAVRVQGRKFYFTVTGTLDKCIRFMDASFPGAWMTSGGGADVTYGLPPDEVARVLAELEMDSDWLRHNNDEAAFEAGAITNGSAVPSFPRAATATTKIDRSTIAAFTNASSRSATVSPADGSRLHTPSTQASNRYRPSASIVSGPEVARV